MQFFVKENYKAYADTASAWMKGMIKEYDGDLYGRLLEMARLARSPPLSFTQINVGIALE